MIHQIDTVFRERREASARRKREARRRRLTLIGGTAIVLATAGAVYGTLDLWLSNDEDEELHAVEDGSDLPTDAPVYIPAIVGLPGDPMLLTLSGGGQDGSKMRILPRPEGLASAGIAATIEVLSDEMLSSSERFMTTIPSTQEDFAFFQAQRASATIAEVTVASEASDSTTTAPAVGAADEEDAGWDRLEPGDSVELPLFEKTTVENTTTVAVSVAEPDRFEPVADTFVRIVSTRRLDAVLTEAGFATDEAKAALDGLASKFQVAELQPGFVVAMRGFRSGRAAPRRLVQLSVYSPGKYIGTLALNTQGILTKAVDPWIADDLFTYSATAASGVSQQYRLLDAIYSTGIRNDIPSAVVGEAIVLLSRGNDLNAFVSPKEMLNLIYTQQPRGTAGAGRVLYVGIRGPDRTIDCFAYAQQNGDFGCVSETEPSRSVTITNGMTTPVNGVMTSTFGPRRHPILNTVRIHKGVDWAAPIGTPIVAAFDGEIVFQGDGGGYGNLVSIRHADGRETRYAHMQRFGPQPGAGTLVKAGEIIGYVGTTGLSTGPHLHFEVYQGGEAINPLGGVVVAAVATSSDEAAVEKLTNRIIHVESGGSATAKNPLSSATGLGQFISKTWLRMINTYRPDLARSLSTQEILALRFDPTISREMVKNLAREGEAYLRQRGHGITAGRLYLCHFLGMEGAHLVLSAARDTQLVNVVGASVISANPFLTGKDAGYVVDWAERKMSGRAPAPTAAPSTTVVQVNTLPPEFASYREAIGELLREMASTDTL